MIFRNGFKITIFHKLWFVTKKPVTWVVKGTGCLAKLAVIGLISVTDRLCKIVIGMFNDLFNHLLLQAVQNNFSEEVS